MGNGFDTKNPLSWIVLFFIVFVGINLFFGFWAAVWFLGVIISAFVILVVYSYYKV